MDLQIGKHVAAVVGGASGIGYAIACAFAQEGADVALLDRDPTVVERARGLSQEHGVSAHGVVCDIVEHARVEECAREVRETLGGCDHVVHAAAVGSGKFGFPFLNLEPADWDRVLRVNVTGAVHVAHAFTPGLVEQGGGTFLFLASVAGQIGSQTDPPYSASKAALINFAQCVAKDLAPRGVRANTLCPGMVKTPLNRSVWEAWNARQDAADRREYEVWAQEKIDQLIPLGRWQQPEDLAAMAVFLASPKAKNVTAQTINVDGGYVIR